MLAQLDEFTFETDETAYQTITRSIEYKYNTIQRLGNFNEYQAVGKYEEAITFAGTLIAKSQEQLNDFEEIAKTKEPKTLVFLKDKIRTVIVNSISLNKSRFLNDGMFLKQDFTISITVVNDENI